MSQQLPMKTSTDLELITAGVEAIRNVKTLLKAAQWQRAAHIADLLLDQLAYDINRRRQGRSPCSHDIYEPVGPRARIVQSTKQSASRKA